VRRGLASGPRTPFDAFARHSRLAVEGPLTQASAMASAAHRAHRIDPLPQGVSGTREPSTAAAVPRARGARATGEDAASVLRLVQATLIAVCGALRQQACDHDEELAAVLEQHGIRVLDALLSDGPRPPASGAERAPGRR